MSQNSEILSKTDVMQVENVMAKEISTKLSDKKYVKLSKKVKELKKISISSTNPIYVLDAEFFGNTTQFPIELTIIRLISTQDRWIMDTDVFHHYIKPDNHTIEKEPKFSVNDAKNRIHLLDIKDLPRGYLEKGEAIVKLYRFLQINDEKDCQDLLLFSKGPSDHDALMNLWKPNLKIMVRDCNDYEQFQAIKKLHLVVDFCNFHFGKTVFNDRAGTESAHCSLNDTKNLAHHFLTCLNGKNQDEKSVPLPDLIEDTKTLQKVVSSLKSVKRVLLDCEGNNLCRLGEIGLLQIIVFDSSSPKVHFVDMIKIPPRESVPLLKFILESQNIQKILWDCRRDCEALFHQFGITVTNVLDLQLLYVGYKSSNFTIFDCALYEYRPSFAFVCENVLQVAFDKSVHNEIDSSEWLKRPLNNKLLEYTVHEMNHFISLAKTLLSVKNFDFSKTLDRSHYRSISYRDFIAADNCDEIKHEIVQRGMHQMHVFTFPTRSFKLLTQQKGFYLKKLNWTMKCCEVYSGDERSGNNRLFLIGEAWQLKFAKTNIAKMLEKLEFDAALEEKKRMEKLNKVDSLEKIENELKNLIPPKTINETVLTQDAPKEVKSVKEIVQAPKKVDVTQPNESAVKEKIPSSESDQGLIKEMEKMKLQLETIQKTLDVSKMKHIDEIKGLNAQVLSLKTENTYIKKQLQQIQQENAILKKNVSKVSQTPKSVTNEQKEKKKVSIDKKDPGVSIEKSPKKNKIPQVVKIYTPLSTNTTDQHLEQNQPTKKVKEEKKLIGIDNKKPDPKKLSPEK